MSAPDWRDILRACPVDRPVFLPGACGEPTAVLAAVRDDPSLFADRTIFSGHIPQANTIDPTGGAPGARLRSIFPCPSEANAALLPWPYSRLYDWLATPGNVGLAVCQVAAATGDNFSLGLSADFIPALLAAGTPIIGQINPSLPAAAGAPCVPSDRFAAVFEADTALPEFVESTPDEATARIGKAIAALIRPGDTVQLGLGKVQAAVLDALVADPRPITLHGGMVTGRALPLIDTGSVSSVTAGVLLGDRATYDRAPSLEAVRLCPVDETHGGASLAQHEALVTANSILSIDLAGQATGETAAGRTVSASGGLTDFHRAALAAPLGRAILALRATTRSGESTIVPEHPAGTRIGLGALDADIVVTEHGVARLRELDREARRTALVRIAAPEHRPDLERATI